MKITQSTIQLYELRDIGNGRWADTWLREKWRQYKSKRVCGVDDNGDDLPF